MLRISLQGAQGNPEAIGARVSLSGEGVVPQTAEIHAGSGYLSQSSSDLYFGIADTSKPLSLRVVWPGGEVSTLTREFGNGHLVINQRP